MWKSQNNYIAGGSVKMLREWKRPKSVPTLMLLINRDGSRLGCCMPWLTCVNWVALIHPRLFMEISQGLWGGRGVVVERFCRQRPQTHRQPVVWPFGCSWKQLLLNRNGNSFAVYWKVLSHCLCFAAHLGSTLPPSQYFFLAFTRVHV